MRANPIQTLVVFALAMLAIVTIPGQFLSLPQWLRISVALLVASLIVVDIGVVWSAPNTLIGLLLGLYDGFSYTHWDGKAWQVGTKRNLLLGGKWAAAQTHGIIIYYKFGKYSHVLRDHELEHVRQARVGGVFFMLAYVLNYLALLVWYREHRTAYRNIYFERKAREAALDVTITPVL